MKNQIGVFTSLVFVLLSGSMNASAESAASCSAYCGFSYTYVPCVIMGGKDCTRYMTTGISSEGATIRESFISLNSKCQEIGNNYNQTNDTSYTFKLFRTEGGKYYELGFSQESMNQVCL